MSSERSAAKVFVWPLATGFLADDRRPRADGCLSARCPLTTAMLDLPKPVDDGACRHLPGMRMPAITLPSTGGKMINLGALKAPRTVIYCYPMTGVPGKPLPPNWDSIPGARGCTPQTCGFRDHHSELTALGAEVFGLSTQTTAYQQEMVQRLHVPFEVLSDAEFRFCDALRLPTFEAEGMRLIKRLTLIVRNGIIETVFYPVFPPDESADQVIRWLRQAGQAKPA